jgi:lysophospholipase L1-like esterase
MACPFNVLRSRAALLLLAWLAVVASARAADNTPPVLTPVGDLFLDEGAPFAFTNTASDAETPASELVYSLLNSACTNGSTTNAYNIAAGLAAFREALAGTGAVDIVMLGDSITEGVGASHLDFTSHASILRRQLQGMFGDGGIGLVPFFRGTNLLNLFSGTNTSYRWTYSPPAWNNPKETTEKGPFSTASFATGSGNHATATNLFADEAVLHLVLTPEGTNGPFGAAYQVDNGPLIAFNTYAPAYTYSNLTIPLGAEGLHRVRVHPPSAPGRFVGLWGITARRRGSRLRVHNVGRSGTRAGETSLPNPRAFLGQLNPNLTIIGFSSNDSALQTPTNDYRNNIVALVQEAQLSGSVLLVGAGPRSLVGPRPQSEYHAILREVALTYGCGFLDFNERWGNPTHAQAMGYQSDGTHPTDLGHAEMASFIYCQAVEAPIPVVPSFIAATAPTGLVLNSRSGVLQMKPTEKQGPSTNQVAVRVSDTNSPSLTDTQSFQLIIREVNAPPVMSVPVTFFIFEGAMQSFFGLGSDPDLPANTLTWEFVTPPAVNASLQPVSATGALMLAPTEAQGPSTNPIVVRVTDNGSPPLSATQTFFAAIIEVNAAPSLAPIPDQPAFEGFPFSLSISNALTDPDLPPNLFTFSVLAGPTNAGLAIGTNTGVITWTPPTNHVPVTNLVKVKVTDNGSPSFSATQSFNVIIRRTNNAPVFVSQATVSVVEGTLLTFTNQAVDPDAPPDAVTLTLEPGAPAGLTFNPATGVLSWTPGETEGPSNYVVRLIATDNGTPTQTSTQSLLIAVQESNLPPTMVPVPAQCTYAGLPFTLDLNASDPDLPPNVLAFGLTAPPAGADIDAGSGLLTWTPAQADIGTNVLAVSVRDGGAPELTATQFVTVVVSGPPVITSVTRAGNQIVIEWTAISNKTYQVEWASRLTAPDWQPLPGEVTATAATAFRQDTLTNVLTRFYRVSVAPGGP